MCNIISAQISQKKNDRLKSADIGSLIYERPGGPY